MITDTVGFIRALPPWLIEGFMSTLEEVFSADVVLLVVDASEGREKIASRFGESMSILRNGNCSGKILLVLNKIDLATEKDLEEARSLLPEDWPVLEVSAKTGEGIEHMKDFIFENLHFMSIYLKPQSREADLIEPLIVKDTSTVRDVCVKLHRDFVRKFRYARVKGPSAKFDWQRVGLDHVLMDEDLLTIITRK